MPKDKLSRLFEAALPFKSRTEKRPSKNEVTRSLAECAIICASSISSFTNEKNHVAEFEAWTIFFSYTLALAEQWGLRQNEIQFALDIATEGILSSLERLCDEIISREHFVEGDATLDRFVYGVRMTRLLGLMGIYALWLRGLGKRHVQSQEDERSKLLRGLAKKSRKLLFLWGEAAVPEILAFYFYYRTIEPTQDPVSVLLSVIQGIIESNLFGAGKLANPYYNAETALPRLFKLEVSPLQDSFSSSSYTLESVLHLFVRLNYKQTLKEIFPNLTRMHYVALEYGEPWHFYLHRIPEDTGQHRSFMMTPPHRWADLVEKAAEAKGESVPVRLRDFPFHYLCLICTFPFRMNAEGIRWIDSQLEERPSR